MNQNTKIIKDLDNLVSRIVKARDPMCKLGVNCYYTSRSVDPAHVFGRTNMATRWELMAVFGACRECHSYIDTHPDKKRKLFRQLMGFVMYDKFEALSNTNVKYLPSDLKEIKKTLTQELNYLDF